MKNSNSGLIGHYIAVYAEMFGHGIMKDDVPGFVMDINNDGTVIITVDGDPSPTGTWEADETNLTINIDETDMTAVIGEDCVKFDDMFGMGLDVVLAKEGTPATNSELYIPQNDKNMCGTWVSYKVSDVLGDDASAEVAPNALVMTFRPDYKTTVTYLGRDLGEHKWSLMNDYGSLDESELNITWDVVDDIVKLTYTDDDFYYVFLCKKSQNEVTE